MQRNMEIDRLRSLGIICVMLGHLIVVSLPSHTKAFAHGFGTTIIDLSFIGSGYAISFVILRQIDQFKADTALLIAFIKSFLVRRICRIYPCLWAVFLLVWLGSFFVTESATRYMGVITPDFMLHNALLLLSSTYNFLFLHGLQTIALAPFWSLTIEEQFYLTYPIFLLLTRDNKQRVKLLVGGILLITLVLRPFTIYHYGLEGVYFTQSRCDAFFYGILIFIMSQQSWFNDLKPKTTANPYLSLFLVPLFVFVIFGVGAIGISAIYFLPISTFLCACLFLLATFERGFVTFPSAIQVCMNFLVGRAYSLYVLHLPVILFLNYLLSTYTAFASLHEIARIAILFVLTIIANEPLYRFVLLRYMQKGHEVSKAIMANARNPAGNAQPDAAK